MAYRGITHLDGVAQTIEMLFAVPFAQRAFFTQA
jgi:hypothetical protein